MSTSSINANVSGFGQKTSLKTRLRGKSDIFNFLISEVNPQTASEFYNVLKIATNPKLRKQLANKAARKTTSVVGVSHEGVGVAGKGMKRVHRFRPGTVALREIRKF